VKKEKLKQFLANHINNESKVDSNSLALKVGFKVIILINGEIIIFII